MNIKQKLLQESNSYSYYYISELVNIDNFTMIIYIRNSVRHNINGYGISIKTRFDSLLLDYGLIFLHYGNEYTAFALTPENFVNICCQYSEFILNVKDISAFPKKALTL